jgi:hypothetical protein
MPLLEEIRSAGKGALALSRQIPTIISAFFAELVEKHLEIAY